MKKQKSFTLLMGFLLIVFIFGVITACGTADDAPIDVDETEDAVPTELNIAAIFISPLEEPWGLSFMQSLENVIAEQPHGVNITLGGYTEAVYGAEAEHVLREYAETGLYEIIWATASYSDQIRHLSEEYPEILWVFSGSGNEPVGGNAYYTYIHVHEAAYLLGMIAGLKTETNVIGVVAAYPVDDVNDAVNAFVLGAQTVNPDISPRVTYIESWYDPAKAREVTLSQIAAGADFIYAERFGVFEAASEAGIHAFGHHMDLHDMSPDVVISSTIAKWEPAIRFIIDEWWKYKTENIPYDAPYPDYLWFSMSEGGSDIAPFNQFEEYLGPEIISMIEKAKEDIINGDLVVPLNTAPFTQ